MPRDANVVEFNRWLAQAQHDLEAARSSSGSAHFEWACFQAQQAAEKALKAYLFLTGKRVVQSHSVTTLIRECRQIDATFSNVEAAKDLDKYYIPTRYPNGLPEQIPHDYFDQEDANKCIGHAETVIGFVQQRGSPSTA